MTHHDWFVAEWALFASVWHCKGLSKQEEDVGVVVCMMMVVICDDDGDDDGGDDDDDDDDGGDDHYDPGRKSHNFPQGAPLIRPHGWHQAMWVLPIVVDDQL